MVNWWDWGSQPSEPEQETAPLDFGAIFNTISSWFSPPAPDYGYSYSGDYQEPQPSYDYYEPPPSPEPTWQTPEPSYDYYEPAPVYEEPEPPPVPPSPSWDFPSWLDRVLQSEYMQAIEEPAAEAESLGAAAEAALSAMQTAESANIEAARIFPSAGIGREPMPFVGPQGPTWLPPEQSYTPPGLNPWESLLWLEEQRTAQPEIFPGQKFFEEQVASPFNIIPELIPPAARAPAALRGLYGGLVDIGTHTETAARVSRAIGNAQRLVDNMARLVEENAPLETIQMARRYAEQAIEAADSLARQLGIQYEPGTTRFGPGPVPAREGAEEVVGVGATARAFGPDPSDVYDMRYRVVELDDLIPSHTEAFDINPLYPQELQPRIRDRAAAKLQVGRIINEFTPDALLVDQFALDRGPMIIGSDNVVESGNGRVIALNTMRREHPEKFASYEQGLRGMVSQYGIDPAQLEGMTSPVLVRERTTPVDRVSFTRMANDPSVLAMSPLEQAIQDSQSINLRGLWVPDETGNIDAILRSASNRDFVSRFLAGLPSNVQASLVDDAGQLNVMGLERIKAAMFARTYPSDAGLSLTETFFESIEPQIKNIESGLMASLPKMAQMEDLIRAGERAPELSIAEDLAKTVDVFARLKEQGMKVTDYLDQITLWERELNPFQEELLRHIDGMSRSPKQIREFIGEYADRVIASPSLQQDAMFRQARPTKGGILDAIAREKELGGPLFTQAEEATPAVPVSPQLERPRGGEGITPPARVPEGAAAVTPPEAVTGEEMGQMLGGAGRGIAEGMYDTLWRKLQAGDLTEGGRPSRLLQLADREMGAGNIRTREDLRRWANDVYATLPPEAPTPARRAEAVPEAAATATRQGQRPWPTVEDIRSGAAPESLQFYGDTFYRETNIGEALGFIEPSSGAPRPELYLSNVPHLALGQGQNTGVLLEFEAGSLRGKVSTKKPAWEFVYRQNEAEFLADLNTMSEYSQGLRSITINPDAKGSNAQQRRLGMLLEGWPSETQPDGGITYFNPKKARVVTPEAPPSVRPQDAALQRQVADILGVSPDVINIEQVTRQATEDDWVRYMAERLARDGQDSPDELAQLLWDNMSPVGRAEALDNFTGTLRDVVDDVAEAAAGGPPTRPSPQRVLRAQAVAIDRDLLAPVEVRTARARATAAQSAKQELQRFLDDFRKQLAEAAVALARGSPPPAEVRAGLARSNAIESRIPQYIEDQVTLAQQAAHIWEDSMSPVSVEVRAAAQRLGLSPEQQAAAVRAATPPPPPAAAGAAGAALPPGGGGGPPPGGGATPFGNWAQGKGAGAGGPALPQVPPPSAYPPGRGLKFLGFLRRFEDVLTEEFPGSRAQALGQILGSTPILRELVQLGGGIAAIAKRPVEFALVGREMLRHDGTLRALAGISHLYRIGLPTTGRAGEALGNLVSGVPGLRRVFPGSIWGQLDDKMRLASGALRGQTVGDIGQQFLTNPNAIRAKLTPQQIEYIQIANALSDDVLVLAKHYNIPINEVQGYMTRKVLSKVDQNGDIVAIAYIGGEPKPIGGKLGMQFARHYATEADAIADGFKYAPHWDAMLINLIGFYNRIADEEMSRWFLANEPWRNLAQGQPRFGEAMTQAFPGKVFTGPNAADTIRYLDKTLDRSIPAWFRKGTAPMYTYNTMQRFYALAGDASVYTIQLLVAAYYKPKQFGRALLGGVSAMFDPTYHWNLISQHSSLLNRYPNVILSATGNEMTEALTRGGILTKAPFSIIGKPLKPFQRLFEAALDEWGIRVLQALDPIADTPRRRAELGLFVNEMRGLFSSQRLGVGPVARHMEGLVTIAPRYNRAVAATLLNAVSRWGDSLRGHQTRLALGRLMVGMTASGVVMTALLRREEIEKLLAQGKTEEVMEIIGQHILPTSDSFQTWEVEGQMVGPGSKYRSVLSLLGDMWKDPSSFDPRNAVLWGENLMTNPGFRFLRGNMAASPGSALDLLWGRNYIGEPTRDNWESFFKNIIAKNTLPLSIQSVLLEGTAHGEDTWQGKLIRGGAQFIGWRSYPTPPYLQWHSYAENALGKGWDEISSTELLALRQSDPRAQELYQANIDDMQYRGRGEEYFGRIQEERDIRNSDIDKAAMAVLLGQKDLNWFRTRLQVLQETYANAKAAIDRDPHYAETVKMLAERDPKTLEDYDYSRYMDILGDPSLIDPLTGEIDYDRRDEMVAALKTELGDEERWERIELRRQMEREQYHYFAQAYYDMVDSEVLREYWEAGTIVDAFILENRLDLSQKDRDALETAVKYAIRLGNDEAEKALSTWYGTTIDDNERRKNMEAAVAKVVSKGTDYADLIGTYGGLEFMEGLRKGAGGTISYGITDVRGIGDATAEKLEAWGITSLSQLATLSADEIAFITGTTAYRIRKDKWVEQAADLLKKGRQGSNPIITTTKSSPAKAQTGENDPRTVEAERPKESPLLPAQTLPSQQSKVAAKSGLANFPEDDLTRISGIGDATADKLETAGIVSFDQLMRLTNAQYKAITGSSGTAALTAARTMYETKISLLKKLGIEVPPLSEIPANLESAATTSAARSTYSAATGGGYRAYSYATKPPVVAQPRPITSWSGAQSAIAAALPPDEVAVVLNYLTYQGATLTPQIRNALAKLMSKSPIEGATTLGEYIRALRRLRRNVILAQTYSGGTGYRRESRWARSYA